MKLVEKSVLIWYSADAMFALVTAVPDYPQFLPWCDHAQVLQTHDDGMTAQISLSIGGIRQRFTTRNTHVPGRQVHLQLIQGPFSQLDGTWDFTPVGEGVGSDAACRVHLRLRYGFDNPALAAVVGPVFDRVAGSLVDAFVQRAQAVYG
jgi:ribosome-associated toxin RatA of RatAB toxin-antitoxin module